MSTAMLRAGAALVAFATFFGATKYVVAHPKNPVAPLQPPAVAQPTPRPAAATATPKARITLEPAVRATSLPGITYTHTS